MAFLTVNNVTKEFGGEKSLIDLLRRQEPSAIRAVDDVSLEIEQGDIIGLAGESGCGKTTLGELMLKLIEPTQGSITFDGQPYDEMSSSDESAFRKRVQMIFQDPLKSLNPRFTVQKAVQEPLNLNGIGDTFAERRQMVIDSLEDAGLKPATQYLERYPSELSGGEQQRVAIARALVVEPDLIVADEPVSMLDVSVRASVLNLMKELQTEYNLTYVFISHDLALIRYMCEKTAIMYLGSIVEFDETERLIRDPKHPYTQALIDAVPLPNPENKRERAEISGEIPSPDNPPTGCKFHPRCPHAREVCRQEEPAQYPTTETGFAACFRATDDHEYWQSPSLESESTADTDSG